jgi:hypothetical protein
MTEMEFIIQSIISFRDPLFMQQFFFSSVLAVPVFRSIIGKPFLTRRCSGLTHKAASTAELIR